MTLRPTCDSAAGVFEAGAIEQALELVGAARAAKRCFQRDHVALSTSFASDCSIVIIPRPVAVCMIV